VKIEILNPGAFGSALVHLEPGESFVSESGAMFRASGNLDIDVTTRSQGKGGILAGVKRLLGGENFFFSTYRPQGGGRGEVGLAPTLGGEVRRVELDGASPWLCAGGSYLGSHPDVALDVQFRSRWGEPIPRSRNCSAEGSISSAVRCPRRNCITNEATCER
jgi:uncharacterized protein (AIM24 family)